MENSFISPDTYTQTTETVLDAFEPRQARSAAASYRCKVYRARLEQGSESQITPALAKPKNVRE